MLALAILTFVSFGWLLVVVGAHQAELTAAMSLDLSQAALLGASLAIGAGIGITSCGPLFDRFSPRPLWSAAALVCGLPLLTVSEDMTYVGALLRIGLAGVGGGAYNTVVNAVVAEHYGSRAPRPLAIVHASATVGAVAGPLLAEALGSRFGWPSSFRILGVMHLLAAGFAWIAPVARTRTRELASASRPLRYSRLLPFMAITFAYVSMEALTTLFAVPFAQLSLGLDPSRGRYAISAFWGGVLLSRIGLTLSPKPLDLRAMVAAGITGAVISAVTLALELPFIELTLGIDGLAIGLVYPLAMALIGEHFPSARGTAIGLAGGAGAVGGSLTPWVAGVLGDGLGPGVAIGMVAACAIIVAAAAGIAHVARRSSPG